MTLLAHLTTLLGPAHVLTGGDAARYSRDWLGNYHWTPTAVLRPANRDEVSAALKLIHHAGASVVPVGGNTGLTGATRAEATLMLSLERLNHISEINPATRTATVEAGVVLARIHEAVAEHGMIFPLLFGARGSAMIGGNLSTNAGGSNVLRYGNTRALCLGLEVVLADGTVLDLMSHLHKDNSGYDLRDLFIGAEGTLGIITAAVLKLLPKPLAYATAMVAVQSLAEALTLLNRLQSATGGMVEAFEYMPGSYMDRLARRRPDLRPPFDQRHEVNILVEIASTAPRDATAGPDGVMPLAALLETALADMLDSGAALDAVVAASEAQRREMWARREAAAEISVGWGPMVDSDVSLPLDRVASFLDQMAGHLARIDPAADVMVVAHLGDGNIHYTVWPTRDDAGLRDGLRETVEDVVMALGGSFSAEHGIGLTKLPSMARRKNPEALAVMRQIKAALDPKGVLNPGKVVP